MEFNLRPLKSTDLFAMVRILNGIGFDKLKECINVSKINEARKKLSAEENKDDVIAEIGIEVVTSIAGVLLENIPTIETDLYNFMGSVANMKTKEVANEQSIIYEEKNSVKVPAIKQTIMPEVVGVIVVAEGAGSQVVKENIKNAVEAVVNISAHRIQVFAK